MGVRKAVVEVEKHPRVPAIRCAGDRNPFCYRCFKLLDYFLGAFCEKGTAVLAAIVHGLRELALFDEAALDVCSAGFELRIERKFG